MKATDSRYSHTSRSWIHELSQRVTVTRAGALVVNVAAIVYLLLAKRLFGLRGGRAAHDAERRRESLLTVRQAAEADGPSASVTAPPP